MDLSETVVFVACVFFALYIFLLGACRPFRIGVNEFLCEVFDAALTVDEKSMIGSPVVVVPLIATTWLGVVFVLINIQVLRIPLVLLAAAVLSTAYTQRKELLRKELEDLAHTEL